jgi:hypothetical protein
LVSHKIKAVSYRRFEIPGGYKKKASRPRKILGEAL